MGTSVAWALADPRAGMDAALVRGLLATIVLGVAWRWWVRPAEQGERPRPGDLPANARSAGLAGDAVLPDTGAVARFAFPEIARQWLRHLMRRSAWGVALAVGLVLVSQGVNPRLNAIAGAWALLALLMAAVRYVRLRRLHRTFEVSPFNLTEIDRRGQRRVLTWSQPLSLKNRLWLRRIDVGPPGFRERISLEWELADLQRAVDLIIEYGGFQPAERADEAAAR